MQREPKLFFIILQYWSDRLSVRPFVCKIFQKRLNFSKFYFDIFNEVLMRELQIFRYTT